MQLFLSASGDVGLKAAELAPGNLRCLTFKKNLCMGLVMLCWLLSGEAVLLCGSVYPNLMGTFCREAPSVPGREGQAQPKCRAKHIAAPDVKRTREFAKKAKEKKIEKKKEWQRGRSCKESSQRSAAE